MVWDWIIACYLFLAGLGAGAFVLAVIVGWKNPNAGKLKKIGLIIAPVVVAVGTLLLMVDARAGLMHPLRFFGLLTNFSSIMTWGVVILMAFLLVSVVSLALMLRSGKTPKWLDIVGIVCALGVATYTGMLLGDASVAFPLWNPAVLPLLFIVSAASSGFAAVLLVGHLTHAVPQSLGFARVTGVVFPVLEAVLIGVLLAVTISMQGPASVGAAASVAGLVSGTYAVPFWLGLVIVGLALPFSIEVATLLKTRRSNAGDTAVEVHGATTSVGALPLVGEAGVLVGGFLLRYLVIMAALPIVF